MYNMMVPWQDLNRMHRRTTQFKKGMEQKRWRLSAEEERAVTYRAFSMYGRPLEMVNSFKYLGQVISAVDDDWPVLVKILAKG